MEFSRIPTDNLYKFLAISGLVLFIVSIYFFSNLQKTTSFQVNDLKIREKLNEYALEFELDSLSENALRKDSLLIKHDIQVLSKEIKSFGAHLINYLILASIGIVISIVGFKMWYDKLQKFQDRIIKNEADPTKIHIHSTQFNREFEVYKDIWPKLITLKNDTYSLRPENDVVDSSKSELEIKRERLDKFNKSYSECLNVFEYNRPFYPIDIYESIENTIRTSRKEFGQYQRQNPNTNEYWEHSIRNLEIIVSSIDDVCEKIQKRIGMIEISK